MSRRFVLPILAISGFLFAIFLVVLTSRRPPIPPIAFQPPTPPYEHYIAGSGVIETSSENIDLTAPYQEIIEEIFVQAGDIVKKGAPLFRLNTQDLQAQLDENIRKKRVAIANLEKQVSLPRKEEIPPSFALMKNREMTFLNSEQEWSIFNKVKDKRAISKIEWDKKYFSKEEAKYAFEEAAANYALLRAGAWEKDLDITRSEIEEAESVIEKTLTMIDRSTVLAPMDGEVLKVNVRVGQTLSNQDKPPLIFGSINPLYIRVDIDQDDAWRFMRNTSAKAFVRGNSSISIPLKYVRTEPLIIPKVSFTGDNSERVDTRVLQILYEFEKGDFPVYVGQILDIYIEAQPNRMRRYSPLALIISLTCLAGCNLAPKKDTPIVSLPEKLPTLSSTQKQELTRWWSEFNDPSLSMLIEDVLANNYDFKIAIENLNASKAFLKAEFAKMLPAFDVEGVARRQQISESLVDSQFLGPRIQNFYNLVLEASWEIDLYGKNYNTQKIAFYQSLQSLDDLRDIYLVLISEAIDGYVSLVASERILEKYRQRISEYQDLLDLEKDKFCAGISELQVPLAEKQIIADLRSSIEQEENLKQVTLSRLRLLLGDPSNSLQDYLSSAERSTLLDQTPILPEVLPSELLQRRPDVRIATAEIEKARLEVGISKANLFPSFSLTGSLGKNTSSFSKWFSSSSTTWALGPGISWSIFHFGRLRNLFKEAQFKHQAAISQYQKTVTEAVLNTTDAISNLNTQVKIRENSKAKFDAANESSGLEEDLYQAGIRSKIELISASDITFESEIEYIQEKEKAFKNAVKLYKELGGDWECIPLP